MTTAPATEAQQPVIIKGSWEDLLNQAHRAAANQNDEAIALYTKVRDGLLRLPKAKRTAQEGRLQELLEAAAANLHIYLTQRENYDQALAALDEMMAIAEEDEQTGWQQRRAMVLAVAGRNEEALAVLRALAEAPDAKLSDWGNLVIQLTRLKAYANANAVIEEAAAWQAQAHAAGKLSEETPIESAAYLENLRMIVAISAGQYAEGVAHFEAASELDNFYRTQPHLLYGRLVFHNQLELALPWLKRDTQHPIRANLWHGIVLKRQDKPTEARKKWQQTVNAMDENVDSAQFVELVLTFYYLGDEQGMGLNGVLRALQSGGNQSWVLFFLAGLGWLLRGNMKNGRANLALAVSRRKANAEGTKLSPEVWLHCQDLLDDEILAQVAEYFETEG